MAESVKLNLSFDTSKPEATRDGFGKGLVIEGKKNKDIIALDGDLANSTRSEWFGQEFPDRFFNVGIAEQNLVGMAAGLALAGKIPFACSFAGFLVNRGHDIIRISVAYSNANVKLIGTHGGIQIGEDGPSNQSMSDIASLRALPRMVIVNPCDALEAAKAVEAFVKTKGPMYMRLTRNKLPYFHKEDYKFQLGKADIIKEGKDATILATGALVAEAMKAAKELENEGISTRVINIHTIKPLDAEAVLQAARSTKVMITAEDHNVIGGLGGGVAEVIAQQQISIPFRIIGVKDSFAESATPDQLFEKYGLSYPHLVTAVKDLMKRK
ncbi:transketolase family protein [Candidatus Woesearchaeota archaeon]|nr:transketolase family protein [Candidatus Woesearchaeota archaeon]HIH38466.1 transketolase family protein [Candidatus Woesearchaeota archaeon]HIH49794.1 transketolase family protein [Candidatus Woesearchaeota archaeon]HIJ03479.1 transketolase family protein [Candidatus Woesearchaeota archaeon]